MSAIAFGFVHGITQCNLRIHRKMWLDIRMKTGFMLQNEGSSGVVGSIAKIISTLSAAPSSQAQTSDHQVTGYILHVLCSHQLTHTSCLCPQTVRACLTDDFWFQDIHSASAKCSSSHVSVL